MARSPGRAPPLAYEALRGAGAALPAFAAMAAVSAVALTALGVPSPALVAAVTTAAVSGGPFLLTASPANAPLTLHAAATATPLGVAGVGAACLAFGLLRGWPVSPARDAPAGERARPAVRVVSALAACLGLLALTAAYARGSVDTAGLQVAFTPRIEAILSRGLVRTGVVLLVCVLSARPTPVRPAVRAVVGVCAVTALAATLLGAAAARGNPQVTGAALLCAPNLAFGALLGDPGPAGGVPGLSRVPALMPGEAAARREGSQGGAAAGWGVALAVLAGVLSSVLRKPPAPGGSGRRQAPALRSAGWAGLVVGVAAFLLAEVCGLSLDMTAGPPGLPVAHLGFPGGTPWAVWPAIPAAAAGALVTAYARDRLRARRVRRP